jgi:HEAT repeat protein
MSNNPSNSENAFSVKRESKPLNLVAHLKPIEKVYVRRRAAEVLGNLSSLSNPDERQQVLDGLVTTIKTDDDDEVRAAAIDALYQHGQAEFEYLISELSETSFFESADRTAVQVLKELLKSDTPEFRMVATSALGRQDTDEVAPEVVQALDDTDPRVREQAAWACGHLDDPRVVEPLSKRLYNDRPIVAKAAASALGDIGTKGALDELVQLTQADEESVQVAAVNELAKFSSVKPVVALVEALNDHSTKVNQAALLSLLDLLSNAPAERAEQIRQTAIEQLERADVSETVPSLIGIIETNQRNHYVRTAIWLLSRIAGETHRTAVVDCLVDTLNDPDGVTATLAASSLKNLAGPELEKRLRAYLTKEKGTEASRAKVKDILNEICDDSSGELVTTGVEYTYVSDPSDYSSHNNSG